MSDPHDPESAYSEKQPLPNAPKRAENLDESPGESLPSLTRGAGSPLGSLAQAARGKQIRTARNLFFLVGVLQVGFSALEMFTLRGQVEQELRRVGQIVPPEAMEMAVNLGYLLVSMFMAAGVAFLVLGAMVKRFPLPCTILGLVLFIGIHLISALLNPLSIVSGIILKIIFLVGLIKAIQAAIAYQRDLETEPAT